MQNSFVIVGKNYQADVDNDLLGFGAGDIITPIEETDKTMAHLLARIGKFKSISEARRNNWDFGIPNGYEQYSIGKGQNRFVVTIWNPTDKLQ